MKTATLRKWLLALFAGSCLATAGLVIKPYFNTFSDLVAESTPGVVLVIAQIEQVTPAGPEKGMEIGTGFFIDDTGLVVTNAHVVAGSEGDKLQIKASGSSKLYDATVVGGDGLSDIAFIRIDAWQDFKEQVPYKILKMAPAALMKAGDAIWALGHPSGYAWTLTRGYLSAVERKTEPLSPIYFLQADLRITNGNSGGPLFDSDGDVIGINNMIQLVNGGAISFAIPSEIVEKVLRAVRVEKNVVMWPRIGLQYEPAPDGFGMVIKSITKESDLNGKAKVGEKMVAITTKHGGPYLLNNYEDLQNLVYVLDAGDIIHITILDEHDVNRDIAVKLGVGNSSADIAKLIQLAHEEPIAPKQEEKK